MGRLEELENKNRESFAEMMGHVVRASMAEKTEQSLEKYSDSTRRVIRVCAAAMVVDQSTSYWYLMNSKMKNVDLEAVAKDFYLSEDTCRKIRTIAKYKNLFPKGTPVRDEDKLTEQEKEEVENALRGAIIKYVLFELCEWDIREAYWAIRYAETNMLKNIGLYKDFDTIYKNADVDTLYFCCGEKVNVVFYTLFPEWYKKNIAPATSRDVFEVSGAGKAGLKMLSSGPDFSEAAKCDNLDDFSEKLWGTIQDKVASKDWNFSKVEELFVHVVDEHFLKGVTNLNAANRQIALKSLLNSYAGFVKKSEAPGIFEVMQNMGYACPADAYFLNLPTKQMFELSEWYEQAREKAAKEYHIQDSPSLSMAFALNDYLRLQEGLFVESELEEQ